MEHFALLHLVPFEPQLREKLPDRFGILATYYDIAPICYEADGGPPRHSRVTRARLLLGPTAALAGPYSLSQPRKTDVLPERAGERKGEGCGPSGNYL